MQQNKYQKERDQIAMKAEEAREKARRQYEEKMLNKRAALDAQARKEEQQFRMGLSDKEYKQQQARDAAAAERERSDPWRQQMIAESQARVTQMGKTTPTSGVSASQINNIRSEFKKAANPYEAYQQAVAKYGTELAQIAFPGAVESAQGLARGLSLLDNATDRAKSYLNF
jgi:hypothetical protein